MQIHIRDLLAKSDWAAKAGAFLHDAAVVTLEGLGPVDLVLSDTGAPSDTLNHTDFGALVVPEWLIAEVVSTHEA